MSSYKAISQINHTLRALLWSEFNQEAAIDMPSAEAIILNSPVEALKIPHARLSLWLYKISQNEHVSIQPMGRPSLTMTTPPPLAVDLRYLVTPLAAAPDMNHLILGKTMQIFHENSVLNINEIDIVEGLKITLNDSSLEEASRLWRSLKTPYQLSLSYLIKTVRIDSSPQ